MRAHFRFAGRVDGRCRRCWRMLPSAASARGWAGRLLRSAASTLRKAQGKRRPSRHSRCTHAEPVDALSGICQQPAGARDPNDTATRVVPWPTMVLAVVLGAAVLTAAIMPAHGAWPAAWERPRGDLIRIAAASGDKRANEWTDPIDEPGIKEPAVAAPSTQRARQVEPSEERFAGGHPSSHGQSSLATTSTPTGSSIAAQFFVTLAALIVGLIAFRHLGGARGLPFGREDTLRLFNAELENRLQRMGDELLRRLDATVRQRNAIAGTGDQSAPCIDAAGREAGSHFSSVAAEPPPERRQGTEARPDPASGPSTGQPPFARTAVALREYLDRLQRELQVAEATDQALNSLPAPAQSRAMNETLAAYVNVITQLHDIQRGLAEAERQSDVAPTTDAELWEAASALSEATQRLNKQHRREWLFGLLDILRRTPGCERQTAQLEQALSVEEVPVLAGVDLTPELLDVVEPVVEGTGGRRIVGSVLTSGYRDRDTHRVLRKPTVAVRLRD